MSSLNDFANQPDPQAALALRVGAMGNPDQAASDQDLAASFGVPAASIAEDRELFKQRAAAGRAQSDIASSPRVQNWFATNPMAGKIAHDDTPILTKISNAEEFVAGPLAKGIDAFIMGDTQPAGTAIPQIAKRLPSAVLSGGLGFVSNVLQYGRGAAEFLAEYDPAAALQRRVFGGSLDQGAANILNFGSEKFGKWAHAVEPSDIPGSYTATQIVRGVENLPSTAVALAGGVTVRAAGFGVKTAAAIGAGIGGVAQGGQSYGEARSQGLSVGKSFLYANVDLATETGGEFLGEASFLKSSDEGRNLLSRFLRQQVGEQVGEQFSTITQDFSAWAILPSNKDRTFGDYLAQLPEDMLSTAIQTAVAGATANVTMTAIEKAAALPAFRARQERFQREQTEYFATRLQDILSDAGQSKTRERSPATFQDFMEKHTQDSPFEFAYIDGKTLAQLLDNGGEDATAFLRNVPSIVEQLQRAADTGGDVRIPTADLVTYLPGTALEQGFVENVRADPFAKSLAETKAADPAAANDRLNQEFEDGLVKSTAGDAVRTSRDVVVSHFLDQLNAANRFTPDVNEQYAQLIGNFFAVQGLRLGISPEEMAARYPLSIRAPRGITAPPEGANTAPKAKNGAASKTKNGTATQALHDPSIGAGSATVNVGLAVHGGGAITPEEVGAALKAVGVDVLRSATHQSDTEPTLIAELSRPLTPQEAHDVSAALKQDAIAQVTPEGGGLFGPKAADWGQFNPDFFLTMNGNRLSSGEIAATIDQEAAGWTAKRVKDLLSTYGYVDDRAQSKAFMSVMSPADFLGLTLSAEGRETLASMNPERTRARPLNPTDMAAEIQPIFLRIDSVPAELSDYQRANGATEPLPAAVIGHEGRHRMTALAAAGITQVPVVIQVANGRVSKMLASLQLEPQGSRLGNENIGDTPAQVTNLVPISYDNKEKLLKQADKAKVLFQKAKQARGYLQFGDDVSAIPSEINLLDSANLSTFLHESGHFFLEVMNHIASQPDAPAPLVDDMEAALRWMKIDGGIAAWNAMKLDEKREQHEMFARGFEAYLFEGKVPSVGMRRVFQNFRQWLLAVYRNTIEKLRAPLNDEIRGVFDRMMASDETIRAVESEVGLFPVLREKPEGMTDQQWQDYQKLGQDATETAIDYLSARSLNDMQFARNVHARELVRLKRDAAQKRRAIENEVRDELAAEPVNQAIEFLRRGNLNGEAQEGPTKLYIPEVEALYGKDSPAYAVVKNALGFGKYGMLAEETGLHPEQVAEMFGFSSADQLIRQIMAAPKFSEALEAATDLRMLERYGNLTSPSALNRIASEAVHNEVRARFIATGLSALRKGVGKPRELAKAAKLYAERMIGGLKVREVRPAQYEAAERRAALAAQQAMAKNDLPAATAETRNQLVNLYATREARDAQEEVRKTLAYFRKFDRKATRENIDVDFRDQIDQLLERYELRTSLSDREVRRRAALATWIEGQRAQGFEPSIDPKFLDEARRVHYRDMTMDEFRGLRDAVKNIDYLGRMTTKLLKNKEMESIAAAKAAGAAAVVEHAYKIVTPTLGSKSWLENAKDKGSSFLAMARKFNSYVREMDGNKDRSTLWGLLSRPVNDASDDEAQRTSNATKALHELFNPLTGEDTRRRVYEPAIERSISLETRLAIALNLGNGVNLERIMSGEKWSYDQVMAVIAPLQAHHWQFVQNTWDYINTFWSDIAAKERRVTGVEPEKVEAEPFYVTVDGQQVQMRGGYYPIKYDPDRSSKAEADTAAEVQTQINRGLYARAQTRRGHVEERVKSTGRPMRYDFGVIFEHTRQVIHDLAWHETLIDQNRLLRSGALEEAIRQHYGPNVLRAMRDTLTDIAIGGLPAANGLESAINYLRTGATIAGLGWNLVTAIFQPLGLTNSIVRIGPKYVARGVSRVFRDASSAESTAKWIYEQSSFMRTRGETQMREIAEVRQQFAAKGPLRNQTDKIPGAAPVLDGIHNSMFFLIEKAQKLADIPTWAGAYEKAVDEGESPDRAVAFADQVVRDSQGAGQIADLSAIQRGSPLLKLWTNFYSWFNLAYNQMAESVNDTRRVGASRLPLLAAEVFLIAFVPQFIVSLIRGAISGDDWDKLEKRILEDQLSGALGYLPFMREFGAFFGIGNSYSGPAGARVISAGVEFGKQAQQGEADAAFWRSADNLGGIVFHYPAAQINRTVAGMHAIAKGETRNPLVLAFGPPSKKQSSW